MVKSHHLNIFLSFLKNRSPLKGFEFFLISKKKKVCFKELKNSWFHRKRGTFSLRIFRKGVVFYMLEHTCVPIFPMRVPARASPRSVVRCPWNVLGEYTTTTYICLTDLSTGHKTLIYIFGQEQRQLFYIAIDDRQAISLSYTILKNGQLTRKFFSQNHSSTFANTHPFYYCTGSE